MKRYEKMSKEEIMRLMHNNELTCSECPHYVPDYCKSNNGLTCNEKIYNWLNEEINVKPRYEIYKTAEESKKAFDSFCKKQRCRECKYGKDISHCINDFIYDTEEVQE